MVVLIAGSTHTGKTRLAQKLLDKYGYPYLSIDHLKMGLIRSGHTTLTPSDDAELTVYLWPILREIIKTAIENQQNLIVEGAYIPFDWEHDFAECYRQHIRYYCLIMTPAYIEQHFSDIITYANIIEARQDDMELTKEALLADNMANWEKCRAFDCAYILIDDTYHVDVQL